MPKPLFYLLFLAATPLFSQTSPAMLSGEYYLEGVHEVASGFRFNPDSTFDFYFVYGALDRLGKGKWVQQGDSLILDSPKKPEQDFVLAESKRTDEPHIVIQLSDPNTYILRYLLCRVTTADGMLEGQSDENGRI